MLFRTHFVLALLVALLSVSLSSSPFLFLFVVLGATMLPDIDTMHSRVGRFVVLRPLQWLTKHRGVMHSLVGCVGATAGVALIAERAALPFLLGYATHLAADALTREGVPLFWPVHWRVRGFLKTGGMTEQAIFGIVCIADMLLFVRVVV